MRERSLVSEESPGEEEEGVLDSRFVAEDELDTDEGCISVESELINAELLLMRGELVVDSE